MNVSPFDLEDFFVEYEHRADLVNLASSDALPWTAAEVRSGFPEVSQVFSDLSFAYPDVEARLIPALRAFCGASSEASFDVLATAGAEDAIFMVLGACRDRFRGQIRIAVPYPGFGAFEGIARLFDIEPVRYAYNATDGWGLDSAELCKLAGTCAVTVINNPHNPTGSTIDHALMQEVSDISRRKGGLLLVDEVFRLPQDGPSAVGLGSNVIVVGSLSKVYGFPGLRLGWAVAAESLLGPMRTLQQYSLLSISSLAADLGEFVASRAEQFSRFSLLERNRAILTEWSEQADELLCITPPAAGTTVVLQPRSSLPEAALFNAFLRKRVLLVPGSRCFGRDKGQERSSSWFRMGYGLDTSELKAGLGLITDALCSPAV